MLGLRALLMGSSSLSTVAATDPYFAYVQALIQPASTDTTVLDYSGKGTAKTVTAVNGASVSGGKLVLGSSKYLTVPDSDDWAFGTGDFYIRFKASTTSVSTQTGLVAQWQDGVGGGWDFYHGVGGQLGFYNVANLGFTLTTGTDYDIELTRIAGVLKCRVNGTQTYSAAHTTNLANASQVLSIGAYTGGTYAGPWSISRVHIVKGRGFTSAPTGPTPDTVLYLDFSTGSIADDATGRGRVVTVNGGASVSSSGVFTGYGSLPLDGADDTISFPHPAIGSSDFVLEWDGNLSGVSSMQTLFDMRPAGTSGLYPAVYVSAGNVYLNVNASSVMSAPISAGRNRVVLARTSGVTRLYVNGVKGASDYTDTNNYLGSVMTVGGNSYAADLRVAGSLYSFRSTVGQGRGYTVSTIPIPTTAWPTQ